MDKALDMRFMEGREEGWARGQEEGMSRGTERANIETARRMLAIGLKLDDIALSTGLSIEKIKLLKPLAPDNAIQIPQ
jgi:predicted transposase/invertase (TIGR01784 family)